jgi:DNA-directed RNA polymerase specialized sigma24 family protein
LIASTWGVFLVPQTGQKKEWVLTTEAFESLLRWLDEGKSSGGEKYLEMRRRLVAYFNRKHCLTPDELADDTLNRVARRLTEANITDCPAKYCYIVARFVFLEHLRGKERNNLQLEEVVDQTRMDCLTTPERQADELEKLLNCLERCMAELNPANRDIIHRYYTGKERIKIENRRALADSLGITMNALSIRACRIRDRLEACVRQCANEK